MFNKLTKDELLKIMGAVKASKNEVLIMAMLKLEQEQVLSMNELFTLAAWCSTNETIKPILDASLKERPGISDFNPLDEHMEHEFVLAPASAGCGSQINFNLDNLVALERIEQRPATILKDIIRANKQNILIAGAVGAGKTMFMMGLINEAEQISPGQKTVLVQDKEEIKNQYANMINLVNVLDTPASLCKIVDLALQMESERLIIGDLRGSEIKAVLNCKTPFMACILGTSVMHALHNLEQFSTMNGYVPLKSQIVEQVQIVVLVEKIAGRQVVTEITQITGWDERHKIFESIVLWAKNKG